MANAQNASKLLTSSANHASPNTIELIGPNNRYAIYIRFGSVEWVDIHLCIIKAISFEKNCLRIHHGKAHAQ